MDRIRGVAGLPVTKSPVEGPAAHLRFILESDERTRAGKRIIRGEVHLRICNCHVVDEDHTIRTSLFICHNEFDPERAGVGVLVCEGCLIRALREPGAVSEVPESRHDLIHAVEPGGVGEVDFESLAALPDRRGHASPGAADAQGRSIVCPAATVQVGDAQPGVVSAAVGEGPGGGPVAFYEDAIAIVPLIFPDIVRVALDGIEDQGGAAAE